MNDPRDRTGICRRHERKGPHVITDFGYAPPHCRYCGRVFGKRYKPQARAKWED